MNNIAIKSFLIILIFLLIPCSAYPQNINQGSLVLKEWEFDFGKIQEGSSISHDFIVLNQGDEIIEIQKVAPA